MNFVAFSQEIYWAKGMFYTWRQRKSVTAAVAGRRMLQLRNRLRVSANATQKPATA